MTETLWRKFIDWQVRLAEYFDEQKDLQTCGQSLVSFQPSIYLETHGALQSQPSHYWMLDACLRNANFGPSSHVLDVGCGKGRILSWLVRHKVEGQITGVELDPRVSEIAKQWTAHYKQISILQNSVLYIDLAPYTHIIMFNPFLEDVLEQFMQKLEREAKPGLRLYYLSDQFFGDNIDQRKGWRLIERHHVRWCHGLCLAAKPQRYSVWEKL